MTIFYSITVPRMNQVVGTVLVLYVLYLFTKLNHSHQSSVFAFDVG